MTNKHVTGKLLTAGVRNIFLGDDGSGRGMHLAYDLAGGYAAAVDNAVLVVLDVVAGAAGSDEHLLAVKERAHVPGDSG